MSDQPAFSSTSLTTPPSPDASKTEHLLFKTSNLTHYRSSLLQGLELIETRMKTVNRPFSGILPRELARQFENLDLDRPCTGITEALAELDRLYLEDAVYFHHPHYTAHLNCPVTIPAITAELIQASFNTSVDTWDQSGGATFIEQRLIDWTAGRIGFGGDADGVFTSGGTQSNLMAMLLARDNLSQHLWQHSTRERGLHPDAHRFRIFCSEVSHFSIQKAAALLGLGYDAVVPVPFDDYYRMDVSALIQAVETTRTQGLLPLAVVATAGTTDFGSIDPVTPIAEISRREGMWLHVDAAYGCGLLTSSRHRHLLQGIEQADSVTVDYHKSFLQPVSCSALLVGNRHNLGCVTWHAEYLNPLCQREEGTPNLVDKSLQTTRRFDALKLWLTLRTHGPERLGDAFDQVIHLARQAYLLLLSDNDIEILHQPQLSTLVFRYRPDMAMSEPALDQLNQSIRKALMRSGEAMVAATRVHNRQYLKFTLLNPDTGIRDIQAVLRLIKRHGAEARSASSNESTLQPKEVAHVG
ncbi:aspartate aminotransferase family protein [Marinobacter sp. TBZ242]|uniref:Aspartate aminotransferase family protein n=1 Tax=Marinobacter azerbaijanicus TaxID=3050455 RepID=A0ABT7IFI6_9GAMM|nr:aspartate aminotransferase family protein [Marinobacter sp. TBZ242]MDL0432926.1 aspartate aminotransferase family protein [Marinobacter sp. TBZ242]